MAADIPDDAPSPLIEIQSGLKPPTCDPVAMTLIMPALWDLKPKTWYYGVRCSCERLLALCEDCFAGRFGGKPLQLPGRVTVRCECGALTTTDTLENFRVP